MKKIYRNKLPNDVVVDNASVQIENGELIVTVTFDKPFMPKDGDFLVSAIGNVFIYSDKDAVDSNTYSSYCGMYARNNGSISTEFSNNWTCKEGCRFATSTEKSSFLERLEKEYHKSWNPETKQLEDIRWRAKKGKEYYTINGALDVVWEFAGECPHEDVLYNRGNYFRTPEAAQKVANQIKEIFKNSKTE